MKKNVDIETLLRWTYREELPKDGATSFLRPEGFGFGWGATAKMGMYGADIQEPDLRNRFGLAPDLTAKTTPHPDAVRIWQAVQNLDDLEFDLPEDWYPLSDVCPLDGDLGPAGLSATARGLRNVVVVDPAFSDGSGKRRLRRTISELVQSRSILGPPDWTATVPVAGWMTDSYGKSKWFLRECLEGQGGSYEIETENGWDRKRRVPKAGGYRKSKLTPDPAEAVAARAEYQILHAAQSALVDELAGRLDDHEAIPSESPAWPWEDVDRPAPRVLIDLKPRPPIVKQQRPLAGPPPFRGIERKNQTTA